MQQKLKNLYDVVKFNVINEFITFDQLLKILI